MYDLKCTCPTTKSRIDELTQWSFCIRQFIHSFDHPVRANFGGLRHHLLDGAATPPLQGLACPTFFLLDTGGGEIVDCLRESLRARV